VSGDDASPGSGRRGGDGGGDDISITCAAAGETICSKTDQCSHFLFQLKEPDTATCAARYALQCETQLRAPGSSATAAFVQACAAATAAGSCNDLFDGVLPSACLSEPPGQLANGAACGESTQCASLDCRKATASYCGVCATAAKSGESCTSADCAPGLLCMGDQICRPLVPQGSSCSTNSHCQFPLVCKSGSCAVPAELGATCSSSDPTCDSTNGLVCDPTTSKCVSVALAAAGTTCGVVSGTPYTCSGGALCKFASSTAATGSCLAPALDGASCSTSEGPGCEGPAFCSSGACTMPDPTTCK